MDESTEHLEVIILMGFEDENISESVRGHS